ncbi:copper resistance protein [Rhizobium rhizosphaerae]|uniref:Copper resistance protein n=1 Tax=Xaviernesmea rhizosphaerae TaxID=1672749 RepID=A0ABX3PA59_9HYPH|nr:plastocyanin/azurin family copper-binding protein [Xaviernesmea rhizosphaerae]OQP84610.1 copper resistance protein [Xaviernesmea rhizosphaerae]
MRCIRSAFAAVAFICLSTSAFAATTVKVTEGGEGGGPMTLTLDQSTIKAGETTFLVHNDAMSEEHEMVLVKLKSADQKIVADTVNGRVDEKKLHSLGEVSELKPGADGKLTVKLAPGSYVLLCNIKGHFQAGMHAMLTVTK